MRLALGRLRESLRVLPALFLVLDVGSALMLVRVYRSIDREGAAFAISGGPDSARAVLSTIAASILGLIALVFSITIVTLQLTSSQFSPRALPNFLRDRTSQVTLSTFIGLY